MKWRAASVAVDPPTLAIAAGLNHASSALPGATASSTPMGTWSRRCRSRAKAPVAAELSAGKSDQDPATASAGLSAAVAVALNTRTGGVDSTGAGRGAPANAVDRANRSDPVASQTSPMSTLRTVTVFLPATTRSVGTAEAGSGSR